MMSLWRRAPLFWPTLGWCVALATGLFWFFRERGFDDPFITYRYAAHLAGGEGIVYNLGSRVLSTTTPFYTLLLAPVSWLGLDLPLSSNLIGCVSLAVGGWVLWWLGRHWASTGVAWAGLLLLPTFPHLLLTLGAESSFFLACVLLAFYSYETRRYTTAAVLLAIATLTRVDAVLAGAVMALDFLLVRREPLPRRALLVFIGLLLPWFVFAWLYFGAPLPVTLFVKQQQGLLPNSESFFNGLFYYGRGYWLQPRYWPHFGLAGLGVVYGLARSPGRLLIPGWSLLYFVAYSSLGVTRYFWYYAPLVPGLVVLIGLGLDSIGGLVGRSARLRIGRWPVLLLVMAMFLAQVASLNTLRTMNDRRLGIYRTVGEWLAANTPPDASVGTLEVGIIGYYSQRQMVDFAGLIQPEVALQFGPASDYDDAAMWAIERFKPEYLVVTSGAALVQAPAIATQCRPVKTFSDPTYAGQLEVFSCG